MNVEIRQIIYGILIYWSLVVAEKRHTVVYARKTPETHLNPPRFSQMKGYGTVEEVEPSPNIRIYVYNPPNTFNPTNELFSKRTLRELESERFKDQSQRMENHFSKLKESQKRQLAMIMDAIEIGSREK